MTHVSYRCGMARAVNLPFSGRKLRALRERRGWTQEDLALATAATTRRRPVGRDHISRYETGRTIPSVTSFRALIEALGCAEDDLLDEPLRVAS